MPALDLLTLYNDDKAIVNVITVSVFNQNVSHLADKYFEKQCKNHVKMRSIIVAVGGDYYYKKISIEET